MGVDKVDLLASLASSPEGRLRNVKLPKLDQAVAQLRKARLPLLKRIFAA